MSANYLLNPLALANVTHFRNYIERRVFLAQFDNDSEQFGFTLIENDQFRRLEPCGLTAQFRPDRSTGSCDQYRTASDTFMDAILFQPDLLPPDQVVEGGVADLSAEHLSIQKFSDTWDCLAGDAGGPAIRQRFAHLASGRGWHSDDDLFNLIRVLSFIMPIHDGGYVSAGSKYTNIHQMGGPQFRIVVQKSDYVVAERGIGANLPQQHPSCPAGAVNQQAFAARLRRPVPYPFAIK